MNRFSSLLLLLVSLTLISCERPAAESGLTVWPETTGGIPLDATIEARVDSVMAIMTVEEMVGQTIQADINSITPNDIRQYPLGSILNGGNSAPNGDNRSPATAWLELADEYWEANAARGGAGIPLLWGTDAVHGHSNVVGATIFPHNIGLGATRNTDLLQKIGEITARETKIAGQDWTFAPTLAVVRDDRWGRTYEGYSEDPDIVAEYSAAMVAGIQGEFDSNGYMKDTQVISTAKHFLGDGGTDQGKDQGDNRSNEADLARIHGAGYGPAISQGVQTVMASFSSWNGEKLHGSSYLLTDVLKGRMGFNGFVVGDWNGHGQVPGCEATSCAASLNAGVDMFMAPDSWKGLYENTLAQVNAGEITRERLEDAVRRILRVKFRAGLFDKGRPSERALSGEFEKLGSAEHIAIARQAVRESLVLLKNNDAALPVNPGGNILVAGDGADDIGKTAGGWTLTWQGDGNTNSDFPNGRSIWDGIRDAVSDAGGTATLSPDGAYTTKPDVAIVVFGEDPYAEFMGDRENLDYDVATSNGLEMLAGFREDGITTVSVFLSGRPMWVNPELNASDAFVAAWLPGTQGDAIADVVLSNADGSVNEDFKGTLSFSWPKTAVQTPLNRHDEDYDPLFGYGYGLTYSDSGNMDSLPEESGISAASGSEYVFFDAGKVADDARLELRASGENVSGLTPLSISETITVGKVDRDAQEDALLVKWTGSEKASLHIIGEPIDILRQSNGDMALSLDYLIEDIPSEQVFLSMECGDDCRGAVDFTSTARLAAQKGWSNTQIKLSCFAAAGADMSGIISPIGIETAAAMTMSISSIRLVPNQGQAICP